MFGLPDIAERKYQVRIEYARNLIAISQPGDALCLLRECGRTAASLWLRLAALPHLKRLARKDVLAWLT